MPTEILVYICELFCIHISTSASCVPQAGEIKGRWNAPWAKRSGLRTLDALCLSCKVLRDVAQPLLFRDIQLAGSYRILASVLKNRPQLAATVGQFTSDEVMSQNNSGRPSTRNSPRLGHIKDPQAGYGMCYCVQPVLSLTHNLKIVRVDLVDIPKGCRESSWPDGDATSVGGLVPLLRTLQTLALWQARDLHTTRAAAPDVYRLLRHAPNLKTLVLRYVDFSEFFWEPLVDEPGKLERVGQALARVRRVHLQECRVECSPEEIGKLRYWLGLFTGLEAFSFKGEPRRRREPLAEPWVKLTPASVLEGVFPARETLKWLEIDAACSISNFAQDYIDECYPKKLAQFKKLEALHVHFRVINTLEEQKGIAQRLADVLPRSVESLFIYSNYQRKSDGEYFETLVKGIQARGGTCALRRVSLTLSICKCKSDTGRETVEDCFYDNNQPFADDVSALFAEIGVEFTMVGLHWCRDRWEFDSVGRVTFERF